MKKSENKRKSTVAKKSSIIPKRSREESLALLRKDIETWSIFQTFTREQQEELLCFCMGERGLKITYDNVFRMLMAPDVHPERIEDLISAILGEKVKIVRVLQREGIRLSDDSSLVIMDIIVELEDKSLISVEMQRAGYKFPIERADCYGSDLLLRRYNDIKAEVRQYNEKIKAENRACPDGEQKSIRHFDFSALSKAIIIVIMENSPALFRADLSHAFHHRYSIFDTGIPAFGLREDYYLCLDNYREYVHTEIKDKRDAWMLFLGSTKLEDMQEVCAAYPEFISLYQEVFALTHHPKELIRMYTDVLTFLSLEEEKVVIQDLYDDLKQARERSKWAEEETKRTKEEAKWVKEEIKRVKEETKRAEEETKRAEEEIKRAEEEIKRAEEEIKRAEEETKQAKLENQRLREELQAMRSKLQEE